ncbi:4-hydroxy-tetrahydrodipicolinate synthase [Alkalithermobacter thermoalcaliphilus JW-YL-7 = DSM 7308]|uniref:4-hydroxy-tetrahydrodipicolinate synthase n=1 Tax=Alkalithermobacter thermoalcaliphilus JW-YL-7 = DSM 7308 TaxID=1121328 RepID=A0A150FRN1_CLOPD|nr:Dihydrodipicolinate synthase [[Clostridium] paradoxum JW-YL-7 = DSM 7308]SHK40135.1 4-hydroxy-tetrahydrodipicolinate synthase [[Clostridium] paradoxum JW-YL-7 = DSM 7308]
MLFKGSGVALVTPFKDGKIDFDALEKVIEFHIKEKTDAFIVCGTTGEASTMTDEEKLATIKFVIEKTNKRIPVIAGTGSNDTAHSIYLSKEAEKLGADGLLVITPYYNKATQKGLIAHFESIANSVNIPIIVYNVPGRTGVNIAPNTLSEIAKIKNIVGVKEASGNIAQVAEIARVCPKDFAIYSGNDDMILPLLSLGGVGVISVVANICPRDTHDLVYKFFEGDIEGSRKLQLDMKPLIDALFIEVNPIPVKTAMNLLGFDMGELRLPLTEMSENNLEVLKRELINYGFKLS